jgi:hypothetical protein
VELLPTTSRIRVAVVVRPLQPWEAQAGAHDIATIKPPSQVGVQSSRTPGPPRPPAAPAPAARPPHPARHPRSATPSPRQIALPHRPMSAGGAPQGSDGHVFDFDRVYRADGAAASLALYEDNVRHVLDRFCQGFNGTILA